MSNWPTVRLGDYADSCLGKMLDKEKNRGDFFPYLGNKNIRWGSFDVGDLAQMRFEKHEHERYGLIYGDLVVCEGGEPGRCAIWKNEISGMKIQKALHRIRTKKELDNHFLYYWFLLAGRSEALEPFFTGTTIKHLTGKAIEELDIPLPPKPEQESIANTLRSRDDKIELNRQTNETLEALARALFKDWFVDFGPTRTKAEGGAPYLAPELWALFPDALDDEDKPVGWEVRPLDEIARFLNGLALQKYPASGDEYLPVIKIAELRSGITEKSGKASLDVPPDYVVRDGDVLFSWSGSLVQLVWTGGKGALNQHLFKVTSDTYERCRVQQRAGVGAQPGYLFV